MTKAKETNKPADDHLKYGQGQREQYGEGSRYRPEDLSEGADKSDDNGWAGGDREGKATAPTDEAPGGHPEKKKSAS